VQRRQTKAQNRHCICGADSSFLAVVKGGRWVRLTEPLRF
jgi:hypothetical protein